MSTMTDAHEAEEQSHEHAERCLTRYRPTRCGLFFFGLTHMSCE
jgi:hypothetical protein